MKKSASASNSKSAGASPSGRGRVTSQAAQHATQAAMNKYRMEAAKELGYTPGQGKLTRKQAGQIGGRVVQKMVQAYEKNGRK